MPSDASTGLLIITHNAVGQALLDTATAMFGHAPPMPIQLLPVALDCDREQIIQQARQAIQDLDHGNGVVVVTDAYGSTPNNVGRALLDLPQVAVIAGANLPMLIRIFNYPNKPHNELAQSAIEAGQEGILAC